MALDYHELVDKMMQSFMVREKAGNEADKPIPNSFPKPFITVSRDPGSGGRPIAKIVAQRLKFDFYDNRLLKEVSESAKIQERILEQIDERGRSLLQDITHQLINPDYVSDFKYLEALINVVLSLGYHGRAVIVGRGGNFILPEGKGLRVRITAPYEVRLQRAIYYETKTPTQARETIRRIDEDRHKFVKQYFNKNLEDPLHYDLVINTTFLDMDAAADLIEEAYFRKFPHQKRPSLWK